MSSYYPPDIIDNERHQLVQALIDSIRRGGQRQLDVATGYFAPDVWHLIGEAFGDLDRLRLLMGERPDVGYGGYDTVDLRQYYRKKIADDLASLVFDRDHARLVDMLLAFLRRDSVEVRIFTGPFLHAKAYIFERVSFVGSGNFTPSGLTRNSELLLASTSEGASRSLHEWFDAKWAVGEEYTTGLIEALEASKFGTKSYLPFDVFMKALYEYFRNRITIRYDQQAVVDLAQFQEEGRAEAIRLLDAWNGVLIADAVGLGKTYIGLSLLEHELMHKRGKRRIPRALIICPAQLRDSVWIPRIEEYGIPGARVISQEELGQADFDWKLYTSYDVVLVDESHNFRNPGTNRYSNLSKLIAGGKKKRIILMTATPVNNTLYDLYHQILLLAHNNDRHYRAIGINNLRQYFKAARDGGIEIFDLLEATTVRRSRSDIRRRQETGERVVVNNIEVQFPKRALARLDYDLDGTYQGFYHELVAAIDRLHLVAYNIDAFAIAETLETKQANQRNTALIALMKMLFLKRLESSATAFAVSITRQARFQDRFLNLLRQGKLLNAAIFRKIVALEGEEEERPEQIQSIIDSLPIVPATAFDTNRIGELVANDIATLQTMLAMLSAVRTQTEHHDDKLHQVKELLASTLKGQKVLIFTSYHDTARYLYDELQSDSFWQAAAGTPTLGIITGETRPSDRGTIIARFAPLANTDLMTRPRVETASGEAIQILISTDVLAEGQNLQDAGIILNYDLHWNPVRLIQRAGRIDRIGSRFTSITIYNAFPEQGLEELLGLVRRLAERITNIDRSIGLDASVLGEAISDRSLEQLRRLHNNDQQVLFDLEAQAELISTEDMKFPLISYIQQIGQATVADIPMGIHSGKRYRARNARSGIFLAFRAGDRHFWRFYPADGSDPETQIRTIYPMIACAREEDRLATGAPPYGVIERATRDILQSLQIYHLQQHNRSPMTGLTQKLYNWINRPNLWGGDTLLDPELMDRMSTVLREVSLKPFERDRALKKLIKNYEDSADFVQFIAELDIFFTESGLYQEGNVDILTATAIKSEDVVLVCYEILERE